MKVYKYGDNVDTDVIIPARYLNAPDEKSLASHCMEDFIIAAIDVRVEAEKKKQKEIERKQRRGRHH